MERRELRHREESWILYRMITSIRKDLPKIGTRKLYYMLKEPLKDQGISIGRDKLFDFMKEWDLQIKKRKRFAITTYSNHWLRKYPNLIHNKHIYRSNQVWVSDITYIRMKSGFAYLSLITDAYSRKIIGYHLCADLSKTGPLKALSQAINQKGRLGVIHHSDRGIQYCSKKYIDKLNESLIKISMSEKGSPYQNAIAERINGILKHELGCNMVFESRNRAAEHIDTAINKYNGIRPHMSCAYLTPNQSHITERKLTRKWKTYYKKNVTQYQDYDS